MTPDDVPIPPIYSRLARLSTWLILIGLVFLPTAHIHPHPTASSSSSPSPSDSTIPVLPPHTDPSSVQHAADSPQLTFPIMVLPPLCCFIGTVGIVVLSLVRRSDYRWLSTVLLLPSLTASLASVALALYLVYKDGLTAWTLMETITAILAGAYSVVFIVVSAVVERKCRREVERRDRGAALEAGRGGPPQIPEVERVTSLKDELLPDGREAS